MGTALADALPFAVGLMIVPFPVASVTLLMLGEGGRSKAFTFVVTWIVASSMVVFLSSLFASESSDRGDPATWVSWFKIVLGVALLVLAVRMIPALKIRGEHPPEPPGWLRAIDKLTLLKVAGLSAALCVVNPKNLILLLGAGAVIGGYGMPVGEDLMIVLLFTLLAALTLILPVAAAVFWGERATVVLNSVREWLMTHNDVVNFILLLIFGVLLTSKGLVAV